MSLVSESQMLGPTLKAISESIQPDNHQVFKVLTKLMKFSDADLVQKYDKTGAPVVYNRFEFCLNELRVAGLIARSSGQVWITNSGKELLEEHNYDKIDRSMLKQLPKYRQALAKKAQHDKEKKHQTKSIKDNNDDFLVKIQKFVTKYNQNVKAELLKKLQTMNPYELENVVAKLLGKMGYSVDDNQIHVTKKSNDGGVDGFLNFDFLGLRHVYFQVKRYSSNNIVDRDELQSFYGALHATYHTNSGIFVTTSDFSKGAKEVAKNTGIRLINGEQLVNYMVKFEVMVSKKRDFVVYQLGK